MPVLPDSNPVTQYVQQLGNKMVKVIPQQYSWPYQFHVVQQKEINAFALPGGPIFVNVGTITQADNEAELAGVIAHEMSHVYMQHSAKQMHKNTLPSILSGLGQIAGSVFGGIGGAIASIGGQMAGGLLSMKYSREDEAQADAVGAIILYKVGYEPKAMADFFEKLEKMGGGGPQFMSDHPNPGNRVQAVEEEIRDWPPKKYQQDSPQFQRTKQQANKIKVYTGQQIAEGAKQGTWARQNAQSGAKAPAAAQAAANAAGGANAGAPAGDLANVSLQQVRPSGNFTEFQQGIRIAYPDNWKVMRSQNGITIAPEAGVSQGAVAYGVVIGTAQDQNAANLDQATRDLVQSLQQSSQVQVMGDVSRISVSGTEGRSVSLRGQSPVQRSGQPVPERDWLVTLPNPQGGILYLIFVAPEPDFNQLQSTYERMLKSLQIG
jgi:predicted Zn-dependent protease